MTDQAKRRPLMRARRCLAAVSLSLLAMLTLVTPASAGRTWCSKDPIVTLNGEAVQVWVSIEEAYVKYVNGPIDVKIYTPAEVQHEIVYLDEGFNGYGENLKLTSTTDLTMYTDGSFDVIVRASVPLDHKGLKKVTRTRNVPLQVTIETNGELVQYEMAWDVVDGSVTTVEQTNDATKIKFKVHRSR